MNVQPNDDGRRDSLPSGSPGWNRGTLPASVMQEGQSHRGQGQGRGAGTTETGSGGAERGLAEHQHRSQALQAMESMGLTSPQHRHLTAADAVASWNASPAMLQRELVVARMRSAQARAREAEIQQRLQALSDAPAAAASAAAAGATLSSQGYFHSTGTLVAAAPPLYAGQLGASAQGRIYSPSATARLPLSQNIDQIRSAAAAREQAIMSGLGRDQLGASIFASVIPPPPLVDDLLGSSSARAQPSQHASIVQVPAAVALYPVSSPTIHNSSLLAAQERADLLRRMHQSQQPLVLSPLYGAGPALHSPSALLAAQHNRQLQHQLAMQQHAMQQQPHAQPLYVQVATSAPAAASLAAVPSSAPWVQTNVSVAEASPTRSLRALHAGLGQGIGPAMPLGGDAGAALLSPSGQSAAPAAAAAAAASRPGYGYDGEDRTAYQIRGTFIDEINDRDVLCGRGGRSNHWPGNKRYRRVISEMKETYKSSEGRKSKTGLSRAIVDHVLGYGGRFVREEEETGRYYVLTKAEARVKTSQALREGKDLKWTR